MSREENLLILKMLQEGTITAAQAAELLSALSGSAAEAPPSPPPPPPPPSAAAAAAGIDDENLGESGETFARARAKIAAAREAVAGVQERLSAAQSRLGGAESSGSAGSNPWQAVADALKDVPHARSVADALRSVDPGRIAATARRQARRVARSVRATLGDIHIDLRAEGTDEKKGEPAVSEQRSAAVAVPAGGTLRIRNTLGDILAVGSDWEDARAEGTLQVWADSEEAARSLAEQIQITSEEGTDGPTLLVSHPHKVRGVALDLKVFVPGGIKVSLLSPSGDITAQGVRGGVVLATQSGDALARDIQGDVAGETASGDVGVEGVAGSVTVSSASGDITALRVQGPALKGITQSGNLRLSEIKTGSVVVETVSGDVEAKAVETGTFHVRTVSGDVDAPDIAAREELFLDTVSGSLVLAPQVPLTGSITVAAVSGDAEIRLPPEANGVLAISTKSGDLRGRWRSASGDRDIDASGMASFEEMLGDGTGSRVSVSTVSGDIYVSQPQ